MRNRQIFLQFYGIIFAALLASGSWQAVRTADAAAARSDFKLAYLPCGRVNDQSWSQAGYEGVVAAQKELGITTVYSESIPPANIGAAARDYAAKGYNLVMLHCATFTDVGIQVASQFPNTWFEVNSATTVPKNVISINLQQQQATFMGGVVAGLATKTNRLGSIVAFNTRGFNRQIEGFRLGARFVNPKIELYTTYINSAEDAAKGKEAALAQFDAGADVLIAATDQAATGVFRAADQRRKYVIAEFADQNAQAPEAIIASLVYNQAGVIKAIIKSVVDGTAKGGILEPGVKEGVGTFIENAALIAKLAEDARSCLKLVQKSFDDGQMQIPGDDVMGRQGGAKEIDTRTVVAGGTHPCLNKRP
jgi:basic membrane protein A and related proteins